MTNIVSSSTFGLMSGGIAGLIMGANTSISVCDRVEKRINMRIDYLEDRQDTLEGKDFTGNTGDTGHRGSIITVEDKHPINDGNPTDNATPLQFDQHFDTTNSNELVLHQYNGNTWNVVFSIPNSNAINKLNSQSLLQCSYQFFYSTPTGQQDRPFFIIGSSGNLISQSSVPSNGRQSNTHQGFLTDFDLELAGIILTIKGASTKTATPSTTGPLTLNLSLHTWLENTTSEQTFSIEIPYSMSGNPGIIGTIGGVENSNEVNSNIKFQSRIPPTGGSSGITIGVGELFGLEFKSLSTPNDTTLSDIDNTNIKLIFRQNPLSSLQYFA